MSDAQTGYGVSIAVSDAGQTFDETTTPTVLGECRTFTPPNATRDIIDVTHSTSPGNAREFIAGLIDFGEATFDMNWIPSNPTDALMRDLGKEGAPREYRITFPIVGGSDVTCTFAAFMTGYEPTAPHDDKMTASVTLKVTGDPVWA